MHAPTSTLATEPMQDAALVASCNNCASPRYDVLYAAGVAQVNQIVRCADCGLIYAYPRKNANLEKYDQVEVASLPDELPNQVRHTSDKMQDYKKIADVLEDMLPQKGRFLDIGAFSGILANFFRERGWDAVAVEPDGLAVAYAKATYGLEVHRGTLETFPKSEAPVDAIVMLHVIEHLDDPQANLRHAHTLLRDGGVIVIETPTYDSWSFKLLGRRERSLSCDGHVFFYTEKTLRSALETSGFHVTRVQKVGRTMSIGRFIWNVGVILKIKYIQDFIEERGERLGLHKRYIYLNAFDMVRMYAVRI